MLPVSSGPGSTVGERKREESLALLSEVTIVRDELFLFRFLVIVFGEVMLVTLLTEYQVMLSRL